MYCDRAKQRIVMKDIDASGRFAAQASMIAGKQVENGQMTCC